MRMIPESRTGALEYRYDRSAAKVGLREACKSA